LFRYLSIAGLRALAASMSLNFPSACARMTSLSNTLRVSQPPSNGLVMLKWLAQKSTITSYSWRLLQICRPIVACPSSVIAVYASFFTATCSSGVDIFTVGNAASMASQTASSSAAGCSCASIQASTPIFRACSTVDGVGPNVARRSRCRTGSRLSGLRSRGAVVSAFAAAFAGVSSMPCAPRLVPSPIPIV
jgi:hypothetical protein